MSLFRGIQIKELVILGYKSPVFLPNLGAILKDHLNFIMELPEDYVEIAFLPSLPRVGLLGALPDKSP